MRPNTHNLFAGALFVAIGGWFAASALVNLPVGTAQQMGPGYFPLALASVLIVLGLAIALQGLGRPAVALGNIPWRGVVLILAAPVLFALFIERLGVAPTVFLVVLLTCFASRRMTLPRALAIAAALALLCLLIFKLGLGIPAPIFGRWLSGLIGGA
jgi:putative tricarboxylic transport membrane protein